MAHDVRLLDEAKLEAKLRALVAGSEKRGGGRRDERARGRLGRRRDRRRVPGAAAARARRRRAARAHAAVGAGAPAVTVRPLPRRRRPWRMRQQPVPWAYRVFFRHIGLDPDARPHAGRGGRARAADARRRSSRDNLLDDALLIALVETGVPIWALDAAGWTASSALRVARGGRAPGPGEAAPPCRRAGSWWPTRRAPVAVLFGELAPGHGVTGDTSACAVLGAGRGRTRDPRRGGVVPVLGDPCRAPLVV